MATINGLYVFAESESLSRDVTISTHSAETGLDISDNVRRNPYAISISGKIVGKDSAVVQSKLASIMNKGILVNYSGRNYLYNGLITKFETSHPNTVYGGCDFTMEIKEVKIAKSSYTKNTTKKSAKTSSTQKGGTQQVQKNSSGGVYHTVKKGDTVWALVAASNAPYRSYGKSCQWVMDNNPNAFSRKGDFRTLQIGAKLRVG